MHDIKGFSQAPTNATADESIIKTRLQDYPIGGGGCSTAMQAEPEYKTRFREEYWQLKERYEKLKVFNNKIEAAAHHNAIKEPEHDTPAYLLREQQAAMGEYLHILEVRAVIEGVEL